MDYIKGVFLGQIRADNSDILNEASMNLDSWKSVTDLEMLKDLNANKPILKVNREHLAKNGTSITLAQNPGKKSAWVSGYQSL